MLYRKPRFGFGRVEWQQQAFRGDLHHLVVHRTGALYARDGLHGVEPGVPIDCSLPGICGGVAAGGLHGSTTAACLRLIFSATAKLTAKAAKERAKNANIRFVLSF